MRTETLRRNQGFTMVEMLIAVAIISVLASVAIPSFRSYQWKAKRSEAFTNLGSLGKTQRTYYALYDVFFGVKDAEPGNSLSAPDDVPSERRRPSDGVNAAFAEVGWAPEGLVFYDYDVAVDGVGDCSCVACFTASAYGDVDGDDSRGVVKYVHLGTDNKACNSLMFDYPTPVNADGPIYDSPAALPPGPKADDF